MKYPKILFQNVLLLDNKIVNWKTGKTHWKDIDKALNNRQPLYVLKQNKNNLSVRSKSKLINNIEENNEFFNDTSWYKQFELHEKFNLNKPY